MEKLKVFTAFSGYDSQCLALDRLVNQGVLDNGYDLIGWSEIDKYAIKAHNLLFPQYKDRNYGDISKIDWNNVPDFDLFTYSFPCTDVSNAGIQKGLCEGSGTRSSLLWECRKTIQVKKPKFLLMENVKALVSKKFKPEFDRWCDELSQFGYTNYWKVMNATDYGVPQNRERVFLLSILGDEDHKFNFPSAFPLVKKLKDVLEDNVDDNYYLTEQSVMGFLKHNENHEAKGTGFV